MAQSDVDEALRLMRGSKASLADSGPDGAGGARREDSVSLCYRWLGARAVWPGGGCMRPPSQQWQRTEGRTEGSR